MTLLEYLRAFTARLGDNTGNAGVVVAVDPRPITASEFAVRAIILYPNGDYDDTCKGPDENSVIDQIDAKLIAQGF
jgi:hypothetical protein